jgi:hypothetical protein
LRPTGLSLKVAVAIVAKSHEILGGDYHMEAAKLLARHRADLIIRKTVAEVVAEVIESKEARGKSASHIRGLSSRLNRFARDFAVDARREQVAEVGTPV